MPLLSIIMATKNENFIYIKKCIDSIINQTFKDYIFYIIIDTKKDNNVEYLSSICDKNSKIKLMINNGNPGVSSSRNFGIMNSDSKYIGIVDSDDYYDKQKFEKQINYLENHGEISVIGTNIFLVDNSGKIIGERLYPKNNRNIRKQFLFKMPIANTSVLFRRNDLDTTGIFDENFKKAEDLELWLRFLSKNKKMYNFQQKLVYYRVPADENEKRGNEHYKNYFIALKKHSKNIWPINLRFIPLFTFYLIQLIPDYYLSLLLKTKFVHKIKNIKSVNDKKLFEKRRFMF